MSNVKVDKIPLAESRRVSWLGSTSMSKVTASKIFKTRPRLGRALTPRGEGSPQRGSI